MEVDVREVVVVYVEQGLVEKGLEALTMSLNLWKVRDSLVREA